MANQGTTANPAIALRLQSTRLVARVAEFGCDYALMNIVPWGHLRWVEKHDKLIRRYLADHESEWRSCTGVRRLFARVRVEFRAWKYAKRELQWDKDERHKLY